MSKLTHTDNIIELKNVSFSYGQDDVIHNVSLAIHKGDYLGIVGPNGGGKSTLLKLMLGLLKPQQGEVHLFHTPLSTFHQWEKIGYVSQQVTHVDAHFPMTVFDVVSMGRYPKRRFWQRLTQEDRQKVQESLSHVGMEDFSHSLIGDLSGGQRQRVFIARALATEPEVIVLDEPTVGVDVKTQKQFYSLLQKLHTKHNLTLVLVSHELDIVAHEATEIAYVNRTIDYHGIPQPFLDSEYFEQLSGKGEHSHA